jgi:hypothetical protein
LCLACAPPSLSCTGELGSPGQHARPAPQQPDTAPPSLPDKRRPAANCHLQNWPPLLPDGLPSEATAAPARQVNSHSTKSTENPSGRSPRRDFSRTSIAGHWSSAKLKISPRTDLPVPIKGPARLSVAPRTSTTISPSPPSPPSPPPVPPRSPPQAAPPQAVDPPLQSTPAQGKERNRLPSSSSSFCPTSRSSPCTGSPAPLPLHRPASLSTPSSVLYREGGEVEDGCFAHTPSPFSTFPNRTPLYFPLSLL